MSQGHQKVALARSHLGKPVGVGGWLETMGKTSRAAAAKAAVAA